MSYTLVSASNANVTMPAFPAGTQNPVTATFTVPGPGPVDFTVRAALRTSAVLIRAQCGTSARLDKGFGNSTFSLWKPISPLDVFGQDLMAGRFDDGFGR